MRLPHSVDPLEVVDVFAGDISGDNDMPVEIARLIRGIDMLVYSIHSIDTDVPSIEVTEMEPPELDYRKVYESIARRYPTLGYYWTVLYPIVKDGTEGELAVGDAIDDLADILIGLREVQWFNKNADRKNALAAMRFRYESHLWMHIHPLRQYLEEIMHDD